MSLNVNNEYYNKLADSLIYNTVEILFVSFSQTFHVGGFWKPNITFAYYDEDRTNVKEFAVYLPRNMIGGVVNQRYNQLLALAENIVNLPIEEFTCNMFNYLLPDEYTVEL